jgi:hypothetical protein
VRVAAGWRTLQRWRPYAVAVVAALLIAFFPSGDGGGSGTSGARVRLGVDGDTATRSSAGATVEGDVLDGGPGGGPRAAGGVATGRGGAPAKAGGAAVTGAGMGTPVALAAPDCDASVGKIKIAYTWRPSCVVPWPAGPTTAGRRRWA